MPFKVGAIPVFSCKSVCEDENKEGACNVSMETSFNTTHSKQDFLGVVHLGSPWTGGQSFVHHRFSCFYRVIETLDCESL